jgi:hypothetical protein
LAQGALSPLPRSQQQAKVLETAQVSSNLSEASSSLITLISYENSPGDQLSKLVFLIIPAVV